MRDPLDELKDAWSSVQPPPFAPAEPTDAATQRTLAWLRRAWEQVDVPAPPVAARPTSSARFPWLPLAGAAAAALVALLGAGVAFDPSRSAGAPAPTPVPEAVRIVAATPERIELRSGAVTLVLLQPAHDPSQPEPQEFR